MEQEKVEVELITGGLEAFSKMAEIHKTKATVREASKAFSEMKVDFIPEQISEPSKSDEPTSDPVVNTTPQLNPQSLLEQTSKAESLYRWSQSVVQERSEDVKEVNLSTVLLH